MNRFTSFRVRCRYMEKQAAPIKDTHHHPKGKTKTSQGRGHVWPREYFRDGPEVIYIYIWDGHTPYP